MVSNSAEEETTSSNPLSFVRSFKDKVYASTVTSQNWKKVRNMKDTDKECCNKRQSSPNSKQIHPFRPLINKISIFIDAADKPMSYRWQYILSSLDHSKYSRRALRDGLICAGDWCCGGCNNLCSPTSACRNRFK